MKKLLLIIGFALSLMSAKAQNKYLDCSSEWRYLTVGGLPMSFVLHTKYLDGDTLVNNKVFFKVYFKHRYANPINYPFITSYTYSLDTNKAFLYYLLREDSMHNFIGCSSTGQINMLYNFDSITHLNINDIFPQNTSYLPDKCFPFDGYNAACTVDQKDTFYLGTQMLLGLKTNSNIWSSYFGIIEGIGSGDPFLCSWDGCPDGPETQLHYYRRQSNTLQIINTFPFDSFPKPIRINTCLLPLKLLSFSAQKENNNVLLNWQTTNELNVSHFNIQRSSNGKDFTGIAKVNIGTSSYSFTDKLTTNYSLPTTLYYRLEMVDKDGSKTYSDVKNIEYRTRNNELRIFPNPATAMVSIECKDAKEIMIIDYLGRIIKQFNTPMQSQTINTKQLTKGVYIVKALMNNGEIKIEKLVVE